MNKYNISSGELVSILITNEALLNEIRFLEHESGTHQDKSLNIGDVMLDAIEEFKEKRLKKHQAGLIPKVNHISDGEEQKMDNDSSDNQRLMRTEQ